MTIDPDVKRVSQDAVAAVGIATRLFLEALATETHRQACSHKRHTLRFSDVLAVAQQDQRLIDMQLREVFLTEDMFAAARGERPKAKQSEPLPAGKSIAKFFRPAQQTSVVGAE